MPTKDNLHHLSADYAVSMNKTNIGLPYDWRGAIATAFLGSQDNTRWFCNEHVGYPFLKASATFSPSQFAALVLSIGRDVTADFFRGRA